VSRALRRSALLAVLLGLTLAPKLLGARRVAEPDGARLARDMAAMLRAGGFRTALPTHHLFDYVLARRGRCTMVAANAPASGALRDRFAEEAAAVGPVTYRYRSATARPFPRFLPVAEDYLQRWAYRLGIVVPRPALVAVAASPACRLDGLGWPALEIWPGPQRRAVPT
jgi:hypothetical protein